MTGILSDSSKDGIRTLMDEVTADPHKISGCVAVVVDRDGKTLFSHASGKKGIDTKEPMTLVGTLRYYLRLFGSERIILPSLSFFFLSFSGFQPERSGADSAACIGRGFLDRIVHQDDWRHRSHAVGRAGKAGARRCRFGGAVLSGAQDRPDLEGV